MISAMLCVYRDEHEHCFKMLVPVTTDDPIAEGTETLRTQMAVVDVAMPAQLSQQ